MRRDRRVRHVLVLVAAVAALFVAGCGSGETAEDSASTSPSGGDRGAGLVAASKDAVQQGLDALDADLAVAAGELTRTGLTGAAAAEILQGLVTAHPEVVEFWTQDAGGTIVAIAPADYASYVGNKGLPRDEAERFNGKKQPLLSGTETAEEGFAAATLIYPVPADDGTLLGGVAAFISTYEFLGGFIAPVAQDPNLDKMWAMDLEGTNLYDPDKFHVGLNFYEDALYDPYPEFVALTKVMVKQPSGSGTYEFPAVGNAEVIVKDCTWDTVGLHGTEWRVAASMVAPQNGQ